MFKKPIQIFGSIFVLLAWYTLPVVLDIIIENKASDIYSNIEGFFNYIVPLPMYYLFPLLIITLTVGVHVYNTNENRITAQQQRYDRLAEDSTRALVKSLEDLNTFKIRESIQQTMERFTQSQEYVVATQLYSYSVKHVKRETRIKINYVGGYVSENEDLNAIMQSHFMFDKVTYIKFHQIRVKLSEEVSEQSLDSLLDYIQDLKDRLNSKLYTDYDDSDAVKLAFLRLALDLLNLHVPDIDVGYILDEHKEKVLEERKRTGILRAIQVDGIYTFEHTGIGEKSGRLYLTQKVIFKDQPHIFLITLDPGYKIDLENYSHELINLSELFHEMLQSAIDMGYNDKTQEGGVFSGKR